MKSITVLNNFDGTIAEVVETIERTIVKSGSHDRKGRPQQVRRSVSYKGSRYDVFILPELYGVPYPTCISVKNI